MNSLNLSNQIAHCFQKELSNVLSNDILDQNQVDPKVKDIYRKVGLILSRYKSGKLPKAFKVIPSMKNWIELLQLTTPEDWTPNSLFQAVKSFIPLLSEAQSEIFVKLFIFPKVLKNFEETKELNVHIYNSIKLIIYKPSSFYKGLILPLCKDENFSLKRASVISSIISKYSIPPLPSSAAVILLTKLEFTGPRALIIKAIVEKNYSFPEKVIFEVVNFLENIEPNRVCVIFFQLLHSLVAKYCDTMTSDCIEKLFVLAKKYTHSDITPLVIEILQNRMNIDDK